MNRLSIIEKVKSLMKMTKENGCTDGEAKAAAELARKLINKHNIKDSELQDGYYSYNTDDEDDDDFDESIDADDEDDDEYDDDYYSQFSDDLDDGYTDPDDIEAFFYGNDLYDCFDDLKTWEMHKCLDIFGLGEDYTLQALENAYRRKLKENGCEHINKKSSFIKKDNYFHYTAGYKYAQRHFREFKQCLGQRSKDCTYYKKKKSSVRRERNSSKFDFAKLAKQILFCRFIGTKLFKEVCILILILVVSGVSEFCNTTSNHTETHHNQTQIQEQYLKR